jgi:hypothetical protein
MLDLSRVTLLFVETRAHAITKRVINDCISKANFGDILIYTDKPDLIPVAGARYLAVPDFPNKKEAGQFYYSAAMAEVETDFALMLEWDAGIINPSNWRPEFLDYDYVGAPWNTSDDMKVGNGGFALMSKRLGQFLCDHRTEFPVYTDWDVCRTWRRQLERAGNFKWAPYGVAQDFSWELAPRSPNSFGWHGAFHWYATLARDELVARATLLTETPYLLTKMHDIFRYDPVEWLEKEIGEEAWEKYRAVHARPPFIPGYILGRYMSAQQRAAMQLAQVQRRGLITYQQGRGLKA